MLGAKDVERSDRDGEVRVLGDERDDGFTGEFICRECNERYAQLNFSSGRKCDPGTLMTGTEIQTH